MIALDTNILVHAHRIDAELHSKAKNLLIKTAESFAPWGVCYHSLVEFYGVVTRSRLWHNPSTPEQALDQIDAWLESPSVRVLYDNQQSLTNLRGFALAGRVSGAMIHDARIAACCKSHDVQELWTVDRDFSRFPALNVRNPLV